MDAGEKDGLEEEPISTSFLDIRSKTRSPARQAFRAYHQFDTTRKSLRVVVDQPLVVKLTRGIIETYQSCNSTFTYSEAFNPKRYLTNPSVAASNGGFDNSNSDLILAVNGVLVDGDSSHRYIVKDLLGQGAFGQVAKCWSDEKNCYVAVKVIKNHPDYYRQALVEVTILHMLNNNFDLEDKYHIVRILEYFVYQKHLCIVFEMLGVNLFELLKVNHFKGISLNLIRLFSKQILKALAVLRDTAIIHCDLKPENILLTTSPASAELKLIDFGSSCREDRTVYSYIQSRYYRSPEVVLGDKYTTAIDIWSFGCIAAELFLGLPLFPAESQYDLLQRMIQILGDQPPDYILRNAKNTSKYFKNTRAPIQENDGIGGQHSSYEFLMLDEYESREKETPAIGKHYTFGNLEQIITTYHVKRGMSHEDMEEELYKRLVFVDFLKGLLNFDPIKRWTPRQASEHPFVTGEPFVGSFQPLPETPRMPIYRGIVVDHNPVSGHWLGAGLSPKVSSNSAFQYGSPQYPGPLFSCPSSFSSAGSYERFGDGGVGIESSFGSCGDGVGTYKKKQVVVAMGSKGLGNSPDTWRRMAQLPPSGLGHAPLGLSPESCSSVPMPLGPSPSNFNSMSSHFHPSPVSPSAGSPSRYRPGSPVRSGGGGATDLGKAAALGQYNKHRSLGSPASVVSATNVYHSPGHENLSVPWDGDTSPYSESTEQSSVLGSPCNSSLQGSHHVPPMKETRERVAGTKLGPGRDVETFSYPIGSLGELISKTPPTMDGVADASSPPNPGDWDPNYSEDLLFEYDGGEVSSSVPLSEAAGSGPPPQGQSPLSMASGPHSDSTVRKNSNVYLQGGSQTAIFRPSGTMLMNMEVSPQSLPHYGWNVPNALHYGYPSQQMYPNRLGQQSAHLLQQQQLQYQYHPSNMHVSDQMQYSVSRAQQKFNHQFHAQGMQFHDQPFLHHAGWNNRMRNDGGGGHLSLSFSLRDGRTDHQVLSGSNFGLYAGLDPCNLGNCQPGVLHIHDSLCGMYTYEYSKFRPESGSQWIAGFPTQRPMTNLNQSYSGE